MVYKALIVIRHGEQITYIHEPHLAELWLQRLATTASSPKDEELCSRLRDVESALKLQQAAGVDHLQRLEMCADQYGLSAKDRKRVKEARLNRNKALHSGFAGAGPNCSRVEVADSFRCSSGAQPHTVAPDPSASAADATTQTGSDSEDRFGSSRCSAHIGSRHDSPFDNSASAPDVAQQPTVAPDPPAARTAAPDHPEVAPDTSSEDPVEGEHHSEAAALDHSEGEVTRGSSCGSAITCTSGPQQQKVAPDPSAIEDLVRKRETFRTRLRQAKTKKDMISLTY